MNQLIYWPLDRYSSNDIRKTQTCLSKFDLSVVVNLKQIFLIIFGGAGSFREPLGQTKVMQICQGETLNHQGVITHEVCCLAAQ